MKYGRLTLTGKSYRDKRSKIHVECICECGNIKYFNEYKLRTGHTRSCGCLRKELAAHRARTREYPPMPQYRRDEISMFFKKRTGDKNPAWRGGKTDIQSSLRTSAQYAFWRKTIMERDKYTCQICNAIGGYLEVHHKKAFISILRENEIKTFNEAMSCASLWDLSNGVTMCLKCHDSTKHEHLRERKPSPIKRSTRKCVVCGKSEYVYPSLASRKFCSRECYFKWKKNKRADDEFMSLDHIAIAM